MNFTVRVLFQGLVNFVHEVDDSQTVRAVNAVLADASGPNASSVKTPAGTALEIPAHVASLRVRTADVDLTQGDLPKGAELIANNTLVEWVLDGEQILIEAGSNTKDVSGPLTIVRSPTPVGLAPTGTQERVFVDWFPQFDRLFASPLVIPESLVRHNQPIPPGVAGRLRFTTGTLQSEPLSVTDDSFTFVALPSDTSQDPLATAPGGAHQQALASMLVHEAVYGPQNPTLPTSVRITSQTNGGVLHLRPGFGNTVEVLVRNMPKDDNVALQPFGPKADVFVDYDFELAYALVSNKPDPLLVPARKVRLTGPVLGKPENPCTGGHGGSIQFQ